MAGGTTHHPEDALPAQTGPEARMCLGVLVGVAVVGLVIAWLTAADMRRFMFAYLVAFAFVLSLSIGGLFFVLIQHLTAGWSVVVRRVSELMAANTAVLLFLFVPIAVSVVRGQGELYPWAQPDSAAVTHTTTPVKDANGPHEVDHPTAAQAARYAQDLSHSSNVEVHDTYANRTIIQDSHAGKSATRPAHQQLDELTLRKRPYLTWWFFLIRWGAYFALWIGLSWWFLKQSKRQDHTGDLALTTRMETRSAPAILFFGFAVTFAAWDLLMSLNPHWFSTIFGVYFFAGCVVSSLATIILTVMAMQNLGWLTRRIGPEHFHDLGKLMYGFCFFWAYIGFSQYMLLWYANLPETTGWLQMRGLTTKSSDVNAWSGVGVLLLFGHFLVPFVFMMSRHVKRNRKLLAGWAIWLLLMHYLDLSWLALPELGPKLSIGVTEISLAIALLAVFVAGMLKFAGAGYLIPIKDPRLEQSLSFENI